MSSLVRIDSSTVACWLASILLLAGCSMKSLIYPAPQVEVGDPPSSFQEVLLTLAAGTQIIGWHRPLPGAENGPVMVFFHGNGENLETMKWAGLYDQLAALRVPLLVVDYPGYGRSAGSPSEISLKDAAEVAASWMREHYPGASLIPCGWSLGAALALHVAATKPSQVAGVVAISPWTSLPDVANSHFPDWLVSVGLREKYDSLAAARDITSPTLILHGTLDNIIPAEQGERLAGRLELSRWVAVEGAGHNDLLAFSEVWVEIEGFVSARGGAAGV